MISATLYCACNSAPSEVEIEGSMLPSRSPAPSSITSSGTAR